MTTPDIESPDHTDLKKIDHERFFEAIDSPPLPTEALRLAFRRAKMRSVQRDTGLATTD
ncbi:MULTISPECIES: type II toxin-antitoxin system TacA family antitoxin [Paracoccaceae]|jgi:uncharacterized protein (DUF1778 family)|uniref:DUF1778 domain-containing protein n=1 Tax=Rhodovulum strictum TaxID=58314 RepID=A0A844BJT9_9RHOB|nr:MULTISPECIES: hypothetical protein [Paracoccaceae]MRH22809.1 hypothetical protein [Rhodovulum strictum]